MLFCLTINEYGKQYSYRPKPGEKKREWVTPDIEVIDVNGGPVTGGQESQRFLFMGHSTPGTIS